MACVDGSVAVFSELLLVTYNNSFAVTVSVVQKGLSVVRGNWGPGKANALGGPGWPTAAGVGCETILVANGTTRRQ